MRIIFFIMSFIILSFQSFAIDGVVTVACKHMAFLTESSDKGLVIDVLKEIEKRSGLKLQIDVVATPRATGEFLKGNYDVLCPASPASIDVTSGKFVMSSQILERQEIVFMRKTDKLLASVDDFKGLRVGVLAGAYVNVHDIVDSKTFIVEQNPDNVANMKKLLANRLDVVVAEKFNALGAVSEADPNKQLQYDLNHPLKRMKAFFAMHNDDRGKEINAAFSKAIDDLAKEGFLKKLGLM